MSDALPPAQTRFRYPLRAKLFLGLAALLAAVNLAAGSLLLMPAIPLIPLFVMFMIGNACLLSSAFQYALSQRQAVLPPESDARIALAERGARREGSALRV